MQLCVAMQAGMLSACRRMRVLAELRRHNSLTFGSAVQLLDADPADEDDEGEKDA